MNRDEFFAFLAPVAPVVEDVPNVNNATGLVNGECVVRIPPMIVPRQRFTFQHTATAGGLILPRPPAFSPLSHSHDVSMTDTDIPSVSPSAIVDSTMLFGDCIQSPTIVLRRTSFSLSRVVSHADSVMHTPQRHSPCDGTVTERTLLSTPNSSWNVSLDEHYNASAVVVSKPVPPLSHAPLATQHRALMCWPTLTLENYQRFCHPTLNQSWVLFDTALEPSQVTRCVAKRPLTTVSTCAIPSTNTVLPCILMSAPPTSSSSSSFSSTQSSKSHSFTATPEVVTHRPYSVLETDNELHTTKASSSHVQFMLCEYLERRPMFHLVPGMSCYLTQYDRLSPPTVTPTPSNINNNTNNNNNNVRTAGFVTPQTGSPFTPIRTPLQVSRSLGQNNYTSNHPHNNTSANCHPAVSKQVNLLVNETSPLMARIDAGGEDEKVLVFENQLFAAPAALHPVTDSVPVDLDDEYDDEYLLFIHVQPAYITQSNGSHSSSSPHTQPLEFCPAQNSSAPTSSNRSVAQNTTSNSQPIKRSVIHLGPVTSTTGVNGSQQTKAHTKQHSHQSSTHTTAESTTVFLGDAPTLQADTQYILNCEMLPMRKHVVARLAVGQQEPKVIVPRPRSKKGKELVLRVMQVHLCRLIRQGIRLRSLRKYSVIPTTTSHDGCGGGGGGTNSGLTSVFGGSRAHLFRVSALAAVARSSSSSTFTSATDLSPVIISDTDLLNIFHRDRDRALIHRLMDSCGLFRPPGENTWIRQWNEDLTALTSAEEECTPEDVAMYFALEEAICRLLRVGIKTPADPLAVEPIVKRFRDPLAVQYGHFILKQLSLTPWHQTKSYMDFKRTLGRLRLDGMGNPLPPSYGYSLLSMRLRARGRKQRIAKRQSLQNGRKRAAPDSHNAKQQSDSSDMDSDAERLDLCLEMAEPTKKHDTKADLRKLENEDIRNCLLQLGCTAADLRQHRWKRVRMIQHKVSELYLQGEMIPDMLRLFIRQQRVSGKQRDSNDTERVQLIFTNQLKLLRGQEQYVWRNATVPIDDPLTDQFVHRILNPKKRQLQASEKAAKEERAFQRFMAQRKATAGVVVTAVGHLTEVNVTQMTAKVAAVQTPVSTLPTNNTITTEKSTGVVTATQSSLVYSSSEDDDSSSCSDSSDDEDDDDNAFGIMMTRPTLQKTHHGGAPSLVRTNGATLPTTIPPLARKSATAAAAALNNNCGDHSSDSTGDDESSNWSSSDSD